MACAVLSFQLSSRVQGSPVSHFHQLQFITLSLHLIKIAMNGEQALLMYK